MPSARSLRKPALLAGCALGAWLAALPATAAAQALQGTPAVAGGTATINTAPGYTQVVPVTSEVVINWEPFDTAGAGTIDFLPAGMTVEFAEVTGTFDYTVLNRILPVDGVGNPVARAVAFNGTVISQIGNFQGGQVWFYSPTGIIAGPTAVFNVGSLILTTNDVPFIAGGPSPIYGPGGLVQFLGPAGSTGFVDIQDGAQINAVASPFGPAYVALIAPRVVQSGLVQANGQIAYIAAEQLNMTINGGLFDFTLTVGTTDAEGIVHTGTTTGPASTGLADQQLLSMIALPKNDALTMLLAGSIGYTPAAVAANDGSAIVLAAGFDSDGPTAVPTNRLGNIAIGDTTFRNALTGYATDGIAVAPTGTTLFENAATLFALNSIDVTAAAATQVTAASSLSLFAGEQGAGGAIGLRALGGGLILVNDTLIANASSNAPLYAGPSLAVDALGGVVDIVADGGTIDAPNFLVTVDAMAGFDSVLGGQAAGGAIDLAVLNGGTVIADVLNLSARGFGGESIAQGGDGFGGAVTVAELGGQLDFGTVSVSALGSGGAAEVIAGSGTGGNASLTIDTQAQSWADLAVDASGSSGVRILPTALTGSGTALNDAIGLTISGPGALALTGNLVLTANSYADVNGEAGFAGQAGGVGVTVGTGGDLTVGGMIFAHASALSAADGSIPNPASAPLQQAGAVAILADGGSIAANGLSAVASAVGSGASLVAGTATGGTATVTARNGGSLQLDLSSSTSLVEIRADGHGAPGAAAADAFGGSAALVAEDGSITVNGAALVSASALSAELIVPSTGTGFAATGGNASVDLLAGALGTASIAVGALTVEANGDARAVPFGVPPTPGGEAVPGDGGLGTGGTARLSVAAGNLTAAQATIAANGIGGASAAVDAPTAFQSGAGAGGLGEFAQSGGTATVTTLIVRGNGQGGGGGPAAAGSSLAGLAGAGTGGTANLTLSGGSLSVTDTTLEALGTGAAGMDHGGAGAASDGGAGTAGTAALQAPAGWAGDFVTGTLAVRSNGLGGAGGAAAGGMDGNGGDGTGAAATIDLADGSFALGAVTIAANGTGGNGAVGGTGTGGVGTFAVVDSAAGPIGTRTLDSLTVEANGIAGLSGGLFPEQSDAGDVVVEVRALDAASAVVINGSVVLNSFGGVIGAPSGIEVDVAGAPLAIGGNLTVEGGDIDIAVDEELRAAADAFLSAERTYQSTGLVATDGALVVQANLGVAADQLFAGGTTFLGAGGGPLSVADLRAGGLVTAIGQSVDIASPGALSFADLDAIAGPLSVVTAGDLALATADATDALTLRSTGGAVTATGAVNAGGSATVEGLNGVTAPVLLSGSTTQLQAANGTVDIDALVSPGAVSVTAVGVDIVGSGPLTFTTAQADDTMAISASGNLAFASVGAGGSLTLSSTLGSLTASGNVAGGATQLNAATDIALAGDLTASGTLAATAGGNFAVAGTASANGANIVASDGITIASLISSSTTQLQAGMAGMVDIDTLVSAGPVSVTGGSVDIVGSGPLTFTTAQAADTMAISASGDLAFASVGAGGNLALGSTLGSLTATGDVAGGSIQLDAANDIAIAGNLDSAGALVATAGGAFSVAGEASAGEADIAADGGIAMATLNSGAVTRLQAVSGNVVVGDLLSGGGVFASGLGIDIASSAGLDFAEAIATAGGVRIGTVGNLDAALVTATGQVDLASSAGSLGLAGPVQGGAIDLSAQGSVTADADLTSAGVLTVDAGGMFALAGTGQGTSILVESADITLGAAARLGVRGITDEIVLSNGDPARPLFVGGGSAPAGYSLEQTEAARLFADDRIEVTSAGNIAVGDLALAFGANGNIGSGGTLELTTPAEVSITGDVMLTTSGGDDTFLIDPTLVELDTSTGSIAMLDGTGNPLGRLEIVSDTFAAATTDALGQLGTLSDFAAINALLDTPGGTAQPLRAGTIAVDVAEALFIQNSGASALFADRRGFAAGGLEITTGSNATRIAINGQILTADGPVSGLATAPLIRINGAVPASGGQFDALSTINGCVIGRQCAPTPGTNPPTSEDVESPIPSGDGPGGLFVAPLIELAGTEPLITPPLVDEPITGVGNDDLWEPRCGPEDDNGPCPEGDDRP